jgi:hypothetical protein
MNKSISLVSRYLLIFLAGLGNLTLFYKVFYPLTFRISSFLFSLFGDTISFYNIQLILFNQTAIEIINACVAGSAYYLLFILLLSLPNINIFKRISMLIFAFGILLVLNVVRILFMGLIAGTSYFESVHMLLWYFVSVLFVVGIWFLTVTLFSIKEIPVYSDLKYLIEKTKHSKIQRKHN